MRATISQKIVFGFLLSFALISSGKQSLSAPSRPHFLVEFTGEVLIKRDTWLLPRFRPAILGTRLGPTDQVRLEAGATARILCSAAEEWQVPDGEIFEVQQGCLPASGFAVRGGADTVPPRGSENLYSDNDPYLLYPRGTNILGSLTSIRWHSGESISTFEVSLEGTDEPWSVRTNASQVEYDGEELIPGYRYWISLRSNNRVIDSGIGVSRLSEDKAAQVEAFLEEVEDWPLDSATKALIVAEFYSSDEIMLYGDAISKLESVIEERTQNRYFYQLLGELYMRIELPKLAQVPFKTALEIAQSNEDVEVQALSFENLAELSLALDSGEEQVVEHLKAALSEYQELMDQEKIEQLTARIRDLENRLGR